MLDESNVAEYINRLIAEEITTGKKLLWKFYKTKEFGRLRIRVLSNQHNECFYCKQKGIIKRREKDSDGNYKLLQTVHHIKEVRKYPALALTEDNLVCVCKQCHNEVHGRYQKKEKKKVERYTNEEKW